MTDKKYTPEGWEQDWEKVNKELNGVNPHAYRLGWLQGYNTILKINSPDGWIDEMQKREKFWVESWNLRDKQATALQAENERLRAALNHENQPAAKPLLGEVHLLTDKQLTDAFHMLFGNDWKKYWTERDKAAEMRSIFNGGTQPCCPFANWVKLMEYLASHCR